MDNLENKQVLSTEIQISDELSDDELTLVSGGKQYNPGPAFKAGENAGDFVSDPIKNFVVGAVGFVKGWWD